MPQQPSVTLTGEERSTLTRARILLKSADGWSTQPFPPLSMRVSQSSRTCVSGSPKEDWGLSCIIKCSSLSYLPHHHPKGWGV